MFLTSCAGQSAFVQRTAGHRTVAGRTYLRHFKRHFSAVARVGIDSDDLRYDVSRLAKKHKITDFYPLFTYKILIMKRCVGNGTARQLHRFKLRARGQHTCASHHHGDAFQPCSDRFRRVFVCNSPAGKRTHLSERGSHRSGIDFHDSTVDIKRQSAPHFSDLIYTFHAFVHIGTASELG